MLMLWIVAVLGMLSVMKLGVVDPLTRSQQQQTFRYLDRSLLRRHFDNPRDVSSYNKGDRDWQKLYQAFNDGWDPGHPATVVPARDPKTHERLNDGTYDVVVGNRRLSVAVEHMIDRIPCIVVDHLSYPEEMAMLMDHATVKGLNRKEQVEAYRTLVTAGLKRDKIADVLGLVTRNGKRAVLKVDELEDICTLPTTIQTEWLDDKKPVSEKSIKPTGDNLKKLTQAIAKDRANQYVGPKENGPAFKEAIKAIKGIGSSDSDYGSKKALRGIANAEKLSKTVETLFLVLSGELKRPLKDCLEMIRWMEQETIGTCSGVDRPAMADEFLGIGVKPQTTEPDTTDSEATEASEAEASEAEASEATDGEMVAASVEPDKLPLPDPTPRRKRNGR